MKTLIIEQVANGWIVREHVHLPKEPMDPFVFYTVKELQEALPRFLVPPAASTPPDVKP